MYDGKQVLRFVNTYKSKDLYNIGNEMNKRKGTGNYDLERTKFNIHFKDITAPNLYQEVKNKLEDNNIEYLHKAKTNMLNGVTITSGPEFFQTLGLKFKESNRVYQSGNKKGKSVLVPDIKDYSDIPKDVIKYFEQCYKFVENTVGKENIIMAQIHFDEDTPHLQAYFLPVVNEVKRKVFEKDSNGNLIKEVSYSKDGIEKLVPKLKRDAEGKIVYEMVNGKFLNNDQFWKDLGGKNSFATIQDSFNKFINEKGFRLDRGQVGSNKIHQDKLDFQISESKAKLNKINDYIRKSKKELITAQELLKNTVKKDNIDELSPKKTLGKYNNKDVETLIDYSTNLYNLKRHYEYDLENKERKIFSLNHSIDYYEKSNDIIKLKQENYNQRKSLDYMNNAFDEIARALDFVLGRKPMNTIDNYMRLAKKINETNKKDKEAQDEFSKLFKNDENEL